jgi:branched-chain amino acid aminotransferase
VKVFLNGKVVEEKEALIPFMDRGVLFGDGLFETVRAYDGKPFRLDRHLQRLRRGCRELRISGLPGDHRIAEAIRELYRLNVGEGDAYIRITVTGGIHDGGRTLERSAAPNIMVVVQPYEGYPRRFYERGVRMIVSGTRRNEGSPLSRLKSNNYLDTIIAKQEAVDRGADDAVMLNGQGYLAEGTSSNIFMVIEGGVATPGVECGLLPGITRETVMELCARLDLPCREGRFLLDDLLGADEAFLSVSTGEIVPVATVEDSSIGEECPGPVTARLARAYRSLVREELAST